MTGRAPQPDFIIIGAMKCGTSTLHEQLARQPGMFMTTPKEPNYFSDDQVFARGPDYYAGLFADAGPDDLRGESSTHYTKQPTYTETLARMKTALDAPRLIYVIRDPVERARSHFIHEWTMRVIECDPEEAITKHPEMVDYGRYGMQIAPFVEAYGTERILLLSLEGMKADPQGTLDQVARFLGRPGAFRWQSELAAQNVSSERLRRIPLEGLILKNPVATWLRRTLVPKALRARVRQGLSMRERPQFSDAAIAQLTDIFLEDRKRLEALFPGNGAIPQAYAKLTRDT